SEKRYTKAQTERQKAQKLVFLRLFVILIVPLWFVPVYRPACAFGYQLRMRTSIDSPLSAAANSSGFSPWKWYGIAILGLNPFAHPAVSAGVPVCGRSSGR